MSLLLPDAQQFVIVGNDIKDELEHQDLFSEYFEHKRDQLKFLEHIDKFKLEDYNDLSKTLFIIKHFDIDPNSIHKQNNANTAATINNNNSNNHHHLRNNNSIHITPTNSSYAPHDSSIKTIQQQSSIDQQAATNTPHQQIIVVTSQNNNNNNLLNNNNNNHIMNPQLVRLAEEETEVESSSFITDYDDIEEEEDTVEVVDVNEQQNPHKSVVVEMNEQELTHEAPMIETKSPSDFDNGYCFSKLMSYKCSIMGCMALLQTIRQLKSLDETIKLVPPERPLQNLAMQNTLITFSGIPSKHEAQQLLTLTRYMGAKSREDVTNKTTHLVAGNVRGLKYSKARIMGLSIMNISWVRESYRLSQFDIDFDATMNEILQHHKLKPFHGLSLAFVGFNEEDYKELCDLTIANEGQIVDLGNITCTHIVLDAISGFDDTNNARLLSSLNQNSNALVVYSEWFWASLEMEGKASEDDHAVPGFKPQTRRQSKARRTSTGYNSFSNMLSPKLDYSRSPETMSAYLENKVNKTQSVSNLVKPNQIDHSKITKRHGACLELLQTERNYVKILEAIVKLFKQPLENPDTTDPILPSTDVKIIFGNLTPIYEVHKKMLSTLESLIEEDWKETNCIGRVYVTLSEELLKAYYPFVNFFEDTKKTINICDEKYPRFHAFLKRCQSNKECNRETLTDMLIRPVQRLPSTTLIIKEIIKRTEDSNPDKKFLLEALDSLRKVTTLINEDKRKTEGQIAMFDIVNNIEDCPPYLLSATRQLVCKVEGRLLYLNSESEVIPSHSHKVVLFLFSDLIEICKIRSLKRSHSYKGSRNYATLGRGLNPTQSMKVSKQKELRHLDDLRLCDIVNIYKKCQSVEMSEAIVIEARPSPRYDQNYRYYPILIDDIKITKATFLERLEESVCICDDPDQNSVYLPKDLPPINNSEIDFGYSNLLVHSMEKSRLSRVLSIRQALMSPSMKTQRNIARINSRLL